MKEKKSSAAGEKEGAEGLLYEEERFRMPSAMSLEKNYIMTLKKFQWAHDIAPAQMTPQHFELSVQNSCVKYSDKDARDTLSECQGHCHHPLNEDLQVFHHKIGTSMIEITWDVPTLKTTDQVISNDEKGTSPWRKETKEASHGHVLTVLGMSHR